MLTSTPDPASEGHGSEAAIAVETFVREVDGRFAVDINVVFPDGGVRHRVDHYRTRRHAEIAASWIRRGAERDIEGPDSWLMQ